VPNIYFRYVFSDANRFCILYLLLPIFFVNIFWLIFRFESISQQIIIRMTVKFLEAVKMVQ